MEPIGLRQARHDSHAANSRFKRRAHDARFALPSLCRYATIWLISQSC
jgi:hypothetical protein